MTERVQSNPRYTDHKSVTTTNTQSAFMWPICLENHGYYQCLEVLIITNKVYNTGNQQTLLVMQASMAAWICDRITSRSVNSDVTKDTRCTQRRTLRTNRWTSRSLTLNALFTCPVFDSRVSYTPPPSSSSSSSCKFNEVTDKML